MHIFINASYSAHVDFGTGLVYPGYKKWLESILCTIESAGHTVFCALRADNYTINNADPAEAFSLDIAQIKKSDAMIALLNDKTSAGVQTEIGYGVALEKRVFLAYEARHKLEYFNDAMIRAGVVQKMILPLETTELKAAFLSLT